MGGTAIDVIVLARLATDIDRAKERNARTLQIAVVELDALVALAEAQQAQQRPAESSIARNVRSYTEGHSSGKGEGMAQVLAGVVRGDPVEAVYQECRRTHPRILEELRIRGITVCVDGVLACTDSLSFRWACPCGARGKSLTPQSRVEKGAAKHGRTCTTGHLIYVEALRGSEPFALADGTPLPQG